MSERVNNGSKLHMYGWMHAYAEITPSRALQVNSRFVKITSAVLARPPPHISLDDICCLRRLWSCGAAS